MPPNPTPAPTPPGAFSANVQFGAAAQRFVATWNAAPDAQRYRVLLKRDEATDFAPLSGAGDLSATTLDFGFAVGLTIQWSAAALRVEACNAVGCTAAADLPLLPHLVDALATKQTLGAVEADQFQFACAADGNTLVVGVPFASTSMGAVLVFTRSGTTWTPVPAILRAPNGEGGSTTLGDSFGASIALSAAGATLVVGAPREDGSRTSTAENENNFAPDAGAAYVFVRNGATYEFVTYLKASPIVDTAIGGDLFGSAVALASDGQTIVVGAPLFIEGFGMPTDGIGEGAVYVFTRSAASWTQQAVLRGLGNESNARDEFGAAVAMSSDGSTIAVGAPRDDGDAQSTAADPNSNEQDAGAAYIFATNDRVQWPRQAYLKAPNAQADDRLARSLALSADGATLAIGASSEDGDTTSTLDNDNDNLTNSGAVYLYTRTDSGWSAPPAYLKPSTSTESARFGASLSLTADANVLAVGAPRDASVPLMEGAAFVYVRVGNAWLEQTRLADTVSSTGFGNEVLLTPEGLTLFVGSRNGTTPPSGTVHVY